LSTNSFRKKGLSKEQPGRCSSPKPEPGVIFTGVPLGQKIQEGEEQKKNMYDREAGCQDTWATMRRNKILPYCGSRYEKNKGDE